MKEITEYIRAGLYNAYNQNKSLKTTTKTFAHDIAEYLITVNIAEEMLKWNEANNWDYSISLEQDLQVFANSAFQTKVTMIDLWTTEIIAPDKKTLDLDDSGRLDVAVFKNEEAAGGVKGGVAYIPIEVKGLNPAYDKVKEDIIRVSKLVTAVNGKADNNIHSGYCAFIRHIGGAKRISKEENLDNAADDMLEKYKEIITAVRKEYPNAVIELEESEIIKEHTKSIADDVTIDDAHEAGEGTGLLLGVIIKITRP